MPQSLSMNLVHLIYSTKNRDASLTPAIRSKLYAYQAGILKEWNSPAIVIGGAFDHVHVLLIVCCAPSGLLAITRRRPRAMPWADMWLPLWGEA